MLNIISQSIYSKKTRGPKKVVENLIRGLDLIHYPYVINKRPEYCNNIWIQDDIGYLKRINIKLSNQNIIIGPNLFINPEDIPPKLNLSKYTYLQPSEIVKNIWLKRGYKGKIVAWPVGIETQKPEGEYNRNNVLIYFKQRDPTELEKLKKELENKQIKYRLIEYGKYKQKDYLNLTSNAKYIIWLGCYESQGIALEEAMSLDIPLLVVDVEKPNTPYDTASTSAPYFDESCGIKIRGFDDLDQKIDEMENNWSSFKPRYFILNNLSLEKQAKELIKLFKDDEKINKNILLDTLQEIRNMLLKIKVRIKDLIR